MLYMPAQPSDPAEVAANAEGKADFEFTKVECLLTAFVALGKQDGGIKKGLDVRLGEDTSATFLVSCRFPSIFSKT